MKKFLADVIAFFFIVNFPLAAQVFIAEEDSLYSRDILTTELANNSNSANFLTRLNYTLDLKKFQVKIKDRYISNITKLERNFIRDANDLDFVVNYKLKNNFYIGGGLTSRNLSDDKNIELNENDNNFFFNNIVYAPTDDIVMTSRLGYKTENQIGEINSGFRGNIYTDLRYLNISDFIGQGNIDLAYENLTQKVNYNYELNTEVYKSFTGYSDNTAFIRFYNRRNDFYFPASTDVRSQFGINNNIESRVENHIHVQDMLRYIFTDELLFTFTGSFSSRNIERQLRYRSSTSTIIFDNNYNSSIKENSLNIAADFQYEKGHFYSDLKLSFSERAETHLPIDLGEYTSTQVRELERIERNKNNSSARTTIALETIYSLSNTNAFRFSGTSSILRYDTDSEDNFDDRDELYLIGVIAHRYSNQYNFEHTTTFDASLSSLGYLFEERSSNNYKNRIFKLTSTSLFNPMPQLLINNSVQVLANYTVYDFEDIVSQVQSFSFRQLFLRDSIYYNVTRQLSLNLFSELKLSEQGEFNDSTFSVKPLAYFDDRNIYARVNYLFFDFIELSAGYKFFQQKRYEFSEGERVLKNTIQNYGPVAGLRLFMTRNSYINFTGGIDYFNYDGDNPDNSSAFLTLNILWNI